MLRHAPAGVLADLRSNVQVRTLLAAAGIDVRDTRAWRLEEFKDKSPLVAALLDWRKAERIATTYGYAWLDESLGPDGRLRGTWTGCDGAAGRMTASSGLHNMPAVLRRAVIAEPGHLFVRADLGQIEPRVLAAVSGDAALAAATAADDMYLPVAAQLGVDRPTAKVAMIAAMYGQTTGHGGNAGRRMRSAYPVAMGYLDAADRSAQAGQDLRTYGGRLIRMSGGAGAGGRAESAGARTGRGRYGRNAVIQGAAAELFKMWAVTVRARAAPLGARIVLCLHDELLVHVPEDHAARGGEAGGRLPGRDRQALGARRAGPVHRRHQHRPLLGRRERLTLRPVARRSAAAGLIPWRADSTVLEGVLTLPRYRRVVVKLSGEALAGAAGTGADPASLARVADEVLSVHSLGVQVAVVVGGGNYFRGRMADGWGISRAEADNIGMLGTVMNALMLRGALTARTDVDVRVMTAVPIHSVAEPFIRLRAVHHLERGFIVVLAGGIGQPYVTTDYPAVQRALELDADALLVAKHGVDGVYDSDPKHNPDAGKFTTLTYEEALAADIRIMDTSAFVLANEQSLTMHVFDVAAYGAMRAICEGDDGIGTKITAK